MDAVRVAALEASTCSLQQVCFMCCSNRKMLVVVLHNQADCEEGVGSQSHCSAAPCIQEVASISSCCSAGAGDSVGRFNLMPHALSC